MNEKINQVDSGSEAPFKICDGVYALTTQGSICYLVEGSERGAVIDTGFGKVDVLTNAKQVSNKPFVLLNTHGHADHIGCDNAFDEAYAHRMEFGRISRKNKNIHPLEEGQMIDLGERKLRVVCLPGHTPGSVAFFDEKNGLIFTGDMVSDRPLFLQFEYSDLSAYVKSMDKLLAMADKIRYVFCCHGTAVMNIDQARNTKLLAQLILDGRIEGEDVHLDTEDGPYDVKLYIGQGAKIYH